MTEKDITKLDILRHSTAHVMAHAVMRLYPDTKFAIGPAIEDGFYYDFDMSVKLSDADFEAITAEMKKICKENHKFIRKTMSRNEALEMFKDQDYKIELLQDIPEDEEITVYEDGDFKDLCRGPHVSYTKQIKHFKLLKIAGAYWRGDENNKMLTRIYGTVFSRKEELEEYLSLQEEAKLRDHRKLGKKHDLFSIQHNIAGPGLVFWHPKGAAVRRAIEDFWLKEHQKHGYNLVNIPHIAQSHLWATSGHLDFYREYMYPTMNLPEDKQEYILKPMNCPGHILIYKSSIHSYREFPLRWAELGTVYRYEKAGVLHGLMRVRGFTQDDAHIFCRPDQLDDEIRNTIEFVLFILKTFGFSEFKVYLSTRPDKYVGDLKQWDTAESALKDSLEKVGLDYEIDPGEGVFYGPKIDIKIKDSLKRLWQCSTIQVDFNNPEKFQIEYVDSDGEYKQPVMIHRALFGSLERFFGVLIEHYAARFPLWLAPVQVEILTVSENQAEYAEQIKEKLLSESIRAELNIKEDKLSKKIWNAKDQNIPYVLVIGDEEVKTSTVSVRKRGSKDTASMSFDSFTASVSEEIRKHQ